MRISLARFAVLALAAVACNDESTSSASTNLCAPSGAAATVTATDNFAFTPSSVTITVGQSVCWQNTGLMMHTVNGANLPSGQALVQTFTFGQSFSYHCNNHSIMTGTVVVNCKPGDLVC
jgi:plastocyanin